MAVAGEGASGGRWLVDTSPWLTPAQRDMIWDPDRVDESSTGRTAALMYSIIEARMGCYVARLAILAGDPQRPDVLFRPTDFWCENREVTWFEDDRFLVVHVMLSGKRFWRRDDAATLCLFDLPAQTYSLIPIKNAYYGHLNKSANGWTLSESGRPEGLKSHEGATFRDVDLRWARWDEINLRRERFFTGWFGTLR